MEDWERVGVVEGENGRTPWTSTTRWSASSSPPV